MGLYSDQFYDRLGEIDEASAEEDDKIIEVDKGKPVPLIHDIPRPVEKREEEERN